MLNIEHFRQSDKARLLGMMVAFKCNLMKEMASWCPEESFLNKQIHVWQL